MSQKQLSQQQLTQQQLLKSQIYTDIAAEIQAVNIGEPSMIARMATTVSLLHHAFDYYFWTGFYCVDPYQDNQLVIGPYQGSLGCLRIPFDKGVCGACATQKKTIIVADVHAFEGHIACDSRSNSEIVVPLFDERGLLAAVLDVDSTEFSAFDTKDRLGLENICANLLNGVSQ